MINEGGNYKTQAHEFYQALKRKKVEDQDSFMYWGKLKVDSSVKSDVAPFSNAISSNEQSNEETHLYITDYHHFWVAKVQSVHTEVFDKSHVLPFYDNKEVELWFKISDMELLSAEFEETSYYLKQLYVDNKFNSDTIESINPYLGGLKFPLIVQDGLNEKYFKHIRSEDTSRCLRENPLVCQPNASGDMFESMKSFVLPPQVFSKLSSATKQELLTIELYLAKSDESRPILFSKVLESYINILESVMNETLGVVLKLELQNSLYISEEGDKFFESKLEDNIALSDYEGVIQLSAFENLLQSMNQFGNLSFNSIERRFPSITQYFSQELIPFIRQEQLLTMSSELKQFENIIIDKSKALRVRNHILGVGCNGVINNLFNLILKYEFDIHYKQVG